MNIKRTHFVFQNQPPNSEPDLTEDLKNLAITKWTTQLNKNEPFIFTIDDDNMTSFIDVKARFTKSKYTVNATVSVEVFVR